jgi:preprotein translocase subunit SecA
MKLALKVFHSGRWFLQYETGQGKTALCLGIAMQRALMGHAVLVVNNSPELAFRDHKKAAQVSQ